MLVNRTILIGDVLEKMKEIPNESIDLIITSPPYWGLRDYGVEGQWGLELDFHEYLAKLRSWMNECKRVLKKTGTCWVNLGDSYNGTGDHTKMDLDEFGIQKGIEAINKNPTNVESIQRKSRIGIPERFYTQCIDDGWIARNHIPWIKENSMPSSVKDRFTNKWESVFFFAKEQKYYFNLDAVRVKPKTETKPFNLRVRDAKKGLGQLKLGDDPRAWKMSDEEDENYNEKGERKESNVPGQSMQGIHRNREKGLSDWPEWNNKNEPKQDVTLGADGKPLANYKGFNERWSEKTRKHYDDNGNCLGCGRSASQHTVTSRAQGSENRDERQKDAIVWCNPRGKNPGDVFKINPKPFPEAHFATFPLELPLTILKCSCPKDGFVLDPFFGSGTVGVAAEQLGLNWIGIELKLDYVSEIILKRLDKYKNQRLTEY